MSRHIRITIAILAVSGMVLPFQNCGKAGFEQVEEDIASTAKPTPPFAFRAEFDQISYNSCFGNARAKTIQAGAYSAAGGTYLDLTAFRKITGEDKITGESIGGMLKPLYPDKQITSIQFRKYISEDPLHMGTRPQLAIRARSNLRAVLTMSGSAQPEVEYVNMLGDLSDDRYLSQLVGLDPVDFRNQKTVVPTYQLRSIASNNNSYLTKVKATYFPLVPGGDAVIKDRLEGGLYYNSSELSAQLIRDSLMEGYNLNLTFKSTQAAAEDTDVAADGTAVIGKSYRMEFGSTSNNSNLLRPGSSNDILNGIIESDLATNKADVGKIWTCGQGHQIYYVVRKADVKNYTLKAPSRVYFRSHAESIVKLNEVGSSWRDSYNAELKTMRNHFTASDWDLGYCSLAGDVVIDPATGVASSGSFRCAVDLRDSCFAHIKPSMSLNYNLTASCFAVKSQSAQYPDNQQDWCLPAISICTKQ